MGLVFGFPAFSTLSNNDCMIFFWLSKKKTFEDYPVQSIDLSHANYKYCFLSNKVKLILLKG